VICGAEVFTGASGRIVAVAAETVDAEPVAAVTVTLTRSRKPASDDVSA
jgi:hypothetical protein